MKNTDLDQRTKHRTMAREGLSLKSTHSIVETSPFLCFEILLPKHLHERTATMPIPKDLTFSLPSHHKNGNKILSVLQDHIPQSSSQRMKTLCQ